MNFTRLALFFLLTGSSEDGCICLLAAVEKAWVFVMVP